MRVSAFGLTTGVKERLFLCFSGSSPMEKHQGGNKKELCVVWGLLYFGLVLLFVLLFFFFFFFPFLGDIGLIKKLFLLEKQEKKYPAIRGRDKSVLDSSNEYNNILYLCCLAQYCITGITSVVLPSMP